MAIVSPKLSVDSKQHVNEQPMGQRRNQKRSLKIPGDK